ncbi:hypothetical protein RRG08_003111 [Elysia crispata]|uniref:Uncharacterized protein n=1 Tax=Elysia crispata TaxID=231223 RepID=A0AAE1B6Z2_9GAST|nr:hypothetical protein RRG08_003111 [Elysia crispata]
MGPRPLLLPASYPRLAFRHKQASKEIRSKLRTSSGRSLKASPVLFSFSSLSLKWLGQRRQKNGVLMNSVDKQGHNKHGDTIPRRAG